MNRKQIVVSLILVLASGFIPTILFPNMIFEILITYALTALISICVVGAVTLVESLGDNKQ